MSLADDLNSAQSAATAGANPAIMEGVRRLLIEIGENPDREGLLKTPLRSAKAWQDLTAGYRTDLNTIINGAIFEESYDEIVAVKHIGFFSLCEHHLLPFFGYCSVGYIPNGRVIGLSKLPRIVDMFARRLQVQERLTQQIAQALQATLQPKGVAVVMEGYHMCMMMRGVEKQDSRTITSELMGAFKSNSQTRSEFMSLINAKLA